MQRRPEGSNVVVVTPLPGFPGPRASRAIALLILAGVVLVGLKGTGLLDAALNLVPGDCTVGLYGAAVSIEAQGAGAGAECDHIVATITTDGGSWYRYSGGAVAEGAVICQFPSGSVVLTVRDQGVLNAYGSEICRGVSDILSRLGREVLGPTPNQ